MRKEKFFEFLFIYVGVVLMLFASIALISEPNELQSKVFSITFLIVGICSIIYGIYTMLSSKK